MMWIATNGQDVREVMNLSRRQREMTLRQYARQPACGGCGATEVALYEAEDGLICALCDVKSDGRAA